MFTGATVRSVGLGVCFCMSLTPLSRLGVRTGPVFAALAQSPAKGATRWKFISA
jgi:hypothetical protein